MPLNLYASLTEFADYYQHSAAIQAGDKTMIEKVLESGSRRIDAHTRRQFYVQTATRLFDGPRHRLIQDQTVMRLYGGRTSMLIPDLVNVTSIKLDEDGNRTFELTLAATDYYLQALGADNQDGSPKTRLTLDPVNGTRSVFPPYPRSIQIIGDWGYSETLEDTGQIVGLTQASTDTTLTVSGAGSAYAVGETLKIGTEQEYVKSITGSVLTVTRAVNGTTAAAHVLGNAISRYTYPSEIKLAALILAGRTWERRRSGYANAVVVPMSGQVEMFRANDPELGPLLAPYRRGDRMVA